MEAPINDSKIVIPFVPSLSHLSCVKVALPLFKDFEISTWLRIFSEMSNRNLPGYIEDRSESAEVIKGKQRLLLIPAHLRLGILQAILGLHSTFLNWLSDHSFLSIIPNIDAILYWKTDGTIDRVKTAQRLLMYHENNLEQRFDLACAYFFEENILALWVQMKESGRAVKPLSAYNPVSRFWVKRMSQRCEAPLLEDVKNYLDLSEQLFIIPSPRFGAFFPLLQPKDRQKFLVSLCNSTTDDFRFCLYGATREEEAQVLRMIAPKVIVPYLDWPLQSFFLEMADRLWNFIDYHLFKRVLDIIFKKKLVEKDYDYGKLFIDFWERSPNHLKEKSMECEVWSRRINFYFDFIKKEKTGGLHELLETERDRLKDLEVAPELYITIQWFYVLHSNRPAA